MARRGVASATEREDVREGAGCGSPAVPPLRLGASRQVGPGEPCLTVWRSGREAVRRGEARQFPAGSLGRDLAERCGRPEKRGERAAGGGFADCPVVSSADTRLGTANGFGAGVKARAVHLPLGW